uniref:phosphoinositide 5-phosphatase n=1 Tax=Poecilia mexicana TaxID=48701 RepID=A0A3B3X8K6_9TELE
MDQSVAIQETLGKEENCIVVSFEPRMVSKIFIYTHRRMAITADDVSLEDIIPITLDFAVVEGNFLLILNIQSLAKVFDLALSIFPLTFTLSTKVSSHHDVATNMCHCWVDKFNVMCVASFAPQMSLHIIKIGGGGISFDLRAFTYQSISSREERDDLVRSSSHTTSNKAQILAMPQFGLRDNLIRCELLKSEDSYTYLENFRFFLGTYNVNGQTPKESLRPWLSCTPEPPDIYCLGFQELDLSKEAFFFSDTPKELEWMKAVFEALHEEANYALVKLIRLVGIMLIFYVKKEHAEFISDVEAETVGTGIMGRMGNKGAVAIRFRFHNSDICVVNSHLAAHVEEYERRNQDFKDICSRLQFRQLDPTQPPLTILKHNVVLWIGDLNYRISDLDVDKVKDLIAKNDFETLHSYDQLKRQIDVEAVFVGFKEGEIDFQPTYKYDTGSDKWDTSEKCRIPAWCDRILWKGKNIQQEHYKSHMDVRTSDHKPVSSLLVIGVNRVNPDAYKKTFEEIVRNIDKMENECIPSLSLSKREFHFKDVKFMQHHAETLNLFNDGQVPCQFEFIQKPNESTYSKPWLTANPPKGFIAQGASMDVDLEVFVNRSMAPDLNCGKQEIEDILVLHLERGKDYFISVTGNYLPSCYGTSIYSLCHMKEPIQDMPKETLLDYCKHLKTDNY